MKKLLLTVAAFLLTAGIAVAAAAGVYYVCGCGPDCKCGAMSEEPGKCGCGKDMVQMHLLKVDGDNAVFCTCGADCECKIDASDPTKCGCGKPVKTASLKGWYVCGCGPDCTCNTISKEPGKCGCGKALRKVE